MSWHWLTAGLAVVLAGCSSAPAESPPASPVAGTVASAATTPVRAAYFYQYMDVDHLDRLAEVGFNRALIKWITDSLGTGGHKLTRFVERGRAVGVEVTPCWTLQARERLHALPTARRYTWGHNVVEDDIACPIDASFWRSALVDRIDEHMAVVPDLRRVLIDLEIYFGGPGHFDAGPCRCRACLSEFDARRSDARKQKIEAFQLERLEGILSALLREVADRHPQLEIGFFDLGFDSHVHEAVSHALATTGMATVNYTEKTYAGSAKAIGKVRGAMKAYGIEAPLVAGLHFKRFDPAGLTDAVRLMIAETDGYFMFTTYSLWKPPDELEGPYTLKAAQDRYWEALRAANQE